MKKGFAVIMEAIMTTLVITVILVALLMFVPAKLDASGIFMSFANKANYANKYGSSDVYYFEFPARYKIMQLFVDDECAISILQYWNKDNENSVAQMKLDPKYLPYFPSTTSSLEDFSWHEKYILCIYQDTRNFPNQGTFFLDDNTGRYEKLAENCLDFFSEGTDDILRNEDIVDNTVVCMLLEKPIIDSEGNGFEHLTGPWNARNINFLKTEKGIMMLAIAE